MQELWLPPNTKDPKVSGRFEDHSYEHTDQHGTRKWHTALVLYTKVPGSSDTSSKVVRNNPEGEKTKTEYAAAWADYQKRKELAANAPAQEPLAVQHGLKGTPIEEADFIGKDRLAFFQAMGFLTIEQVRDMSDTICQNMRSGVSLRKKAAQFLASRA